MSRNLFLLDFPICWNNNLMDFIGIYCTIPFFISNFINLGLYFFWLVWVRVCQACLSFQRMNVLFH
jgi:hypothetical protein